MGQHWANHSLDYHDFWNMLERTGWWASRWYILVSLILLFCNTKYSVGFVTGHSRILWTNRGICSCYILLVLEFYVLREGDRILRPFIDQTTLLFVLACSVVSLHLHFHLFFFLLHHLFLSHTYRTFMYSYLTANVAANVCHFCTLLRPHPLW